MNAYQRIVLILGTVASVTTIWTPKIENKDVTYLRVLYDKISDVLDVQMIKQSNNTNQIRLRVKIPDNIDILYNKLYNDRFDIMSDVNKFRETLNDPVNVRAIYEAIKDKYVDIRSYGEFYQALFPSPLNELDTARFNNDFIEFQKRILNENQQKKTQKKGRDIIGLNENQREYHVGITYEIFLKSMSDINNIKEIHNRLSGIEEYNLIDLDYEKFKERVFKSLEQKTILQKLIRFLNSVTLTKEINSPFGYLRIIVVLSSTLLIFFALKGIGKSGLKGKNDQNQI